MRFSATALLAAVAATTVQAQAGAGLGGLEGLLTQSGIASLLGEVVSQFPDVGSAVADIQAQNTAGLVSALSNLEANPTFTSLVGANPTVSSIFGQVTGLVGGGASSGSASASAGSSATTSAAAATSSVTSAASSAASSLSSVVESVTSSAASAVSSTATGTAPAATTSSASSGAGTSFKAGGVALAAVGVVAGAMALL